MKFRPLKRNFVHLRAISSTRNFCIKMVRQAQYPKTLYLQGLSGFCFAWKPWFYECCFGPVFGRKSTFALRLPSEGIKICCFLLSKIRQNYQQKSLFSAGQNTHNGCCRIYFWIKIKVGINIWGGRNVTVTEPFLNFLEWNAVCIKQTCTTVTKVVKAYSPHSDFL